MVLTTIYETLQTNKMKIKCILFCSAIICLFNSCKNVQEESIKNQNNYTKESSIETEINKLPFSKMTVITFDDCEYLIYKEEFDSNETLGFMAHKGNCKNPIHCRAE